MYSIKETGEKLKQEIEFGSDERVIQSWAFYLSQISKGDCSKEVSELLDHLSEMKNKWNFPYGVGELEDAADIMINEERNPFI